MIPTSLPKFQSLAPAAKHLPMALPAPSAQQLPVFGASDSAQAPSSKLLQAYAGVRFAGTESALPPDRMTFDEFMAMVKEDPKKYIPTARQYFVSGLQSWGTHKEEVLGEEVNVYDFPTRPWTPPSVQDKDEFYGQELVINQIVETLNKLSKSRTPYLIQLVGPNGVGKSQLLSVMQEAMEVFSRQPGGERYTFSVIVADRKKGTPVAFPTMASAGAKKKSSLPKESEISFRLPSPLAVNPLFLLTEHERSALIQELKAKGKLDKDENFDFFIKGGALDKRSQKAIDALRRAYDGDMDKVFREHIQVERYDFPRVIIPAGENPHAQVQHLGGEVTWRSAPQSIVNSGALFEYMGYLPRANGGMINIDDMGRDRRADYAYLLETAQTGKLMLHSPVDGSIEEPVDIIFFSTANPDGLNMLAQQGNFRALKERIITIAMPHERRFQNEAKVHASLFRQAEQNGRKIAPHVQDIYALWATMTRLLPADPASPDYRNLQDSDKFKRALVKLDPLKKALLYQGVEDLNAAETNPDAAGYLTPSEQSLLRRNLRVIASEHQQSVGETNYTHYEGGLGVSARDGDKILVPQIIDAHKGQPLTVLDVFETLAKYIKSEPLWMSERHKFLGDYFKDAKGQVDQTLMKRAMPSEVELLKLAEDYARRQFKQEVREAVEVYQTEDAHIRTIQKYLEHVRAATATEAEEKEVSPEFRDDPNKKEPNQKFMRDIEDVFGISHTPEDRTRIRARLTGWNRAENPAQNIKRLFENELNKMRKYDEITYNERILQFLRDTAMLQTNPGILEREAAEVTERKEQIDRMHTAVARLGAIGYPAESLPKLLGWAFGKGYISDESLEVYGS